MKWYSTYETPGIVWHDLSNVGYDKHGFIILDCGNCAIAYIYFSQYHRSIYYFCSPSSTRNRNSHNIDNSVKQDEKSVPEAYHQYYMR